MKELLSLAFIGSWLVAWGIGGGNIIGKALLVLFLMTSIPALKSWGLRFLCYVLMCLGGVLIMKLMGWR